MNRHHRLIGELQSFICPLECAQHCPREIACVIAILQIVKQQ